MHEEADVKIEADSGGEEMGEGRPEEKIAQMREELKHCRREKQEYMDGWQRAKADYVNLLKRFEAEVRSAESRGSVRAVETLLPAFDALERAKDLPALPTGQAGGRQGTDKTVEGFLAIARQLENAFSALGLEGIGEIGEAFNPAFHDALGQDAVESSEADDTVTAVLEKGWRVDGTVIRPAKVRVAHFSGS